MKNISKILVALLSCLTLVCFVLPLSAENDVEKKESVYAVLNSDGSVESITVSDTLHSDSGFSNYKDTSNLKDVENLKSNDAISQSGTTLVWNTSDTDIYYQGTSDKELPLTVNITYTLDGKQLSADDLVGESGHLKIKINLTNSSKQSYVVNGKTYNLVTPFVTGIVGMFDEDVFKNVTINNGKVTSDSSHSIVVGVVVPGLKNGLSQVLDSDLMHRLDDYLTDEVTIEADVTGFESPTLMMAAATSSDALKDEFDDIDEFSSIFDKLDDLKEATQELIDGTNSLYDGAVKLNDGVGTLSDGTATLSDGTKQLVTGGQTLVNGVDTLSVGVSELDAGLYKAVANNDTLVNGVNTITDAVLATVQAQVQEQLRKEFNDDTITVELNWTNYADVLGSGISDTVRNDTRASLKTAIENVTGSLTDQKFQGILYMCAKNACKTKDAITAYLTEHKADLETAAKVEAAQNDAASKLLVETKDYSTIDRIMNLGVYVGAISAIQTAYPSLTSAQAEAVWLAKVQNPSIDENGIQQAITNAPENPKGINDTTVSAVISSMRQTNTYSNANVYAGLCSKLTASGVRDSKEQAIILTIAGMYYGDLSSTSLTEALGKAGADATVASAVSADITKANTDEEAKTLVDGMINSLIKNSASEALDSLNGALALRKGIKDYTDGIETIYTKVDTVLVPGISSLTTGVDSLYAGIQKVNSGAASLNSGVATLKDGANKLANGAKDLKEGMQKYNDEGISKLTENSRISSIEEASDLLSAISKDENNYDNYSGISDGTDGSVKFVFKINGAKKVKSEDTSSETTKEKTSFWQRIVNLFKF